MKTFTWADFKSQKKLLMLAGWLIAVALIVFFLFYEFGEGDRKGKGLAVVSDIKGQVQVREAEQLLWQPTERDSNLFLNDYIATGSDSSTRILFGNGRVIELSSNTQIRISNDTGRNEDGNYTIDLVKGQIKALPTSRKMAAAARAKTIRLDRGRLALNIRVSDRTFKLQSNKALLELQKTSETAPVKIVAATQGIESLRNGKKSMLKPVVADSDEKAAVPVPAPVPKIEPAPVVPPPPPVAVAAKTPPVPKKIARKPTPKPVKPTMALAAKNPPAKPEPKIAMVNPKDYLPTVASDDNGATFWFTDSLDTVLVKEKLPVTVRAPTQKPDNAAWIPLLNPAPGNNKAASVGKDLFADQDIMLDLGKAAASGAIHRDNGAIPQASLNLSPGALLTRDGKVLSAPAYGQPASVTIRSLKNLHGGVILDLAGLKYKAPTAAFVKERAAEGAPMTSLYLATADGMEKMMPFLQGATGFGVRQGTMKLEGSGTFFVKNNQVIGALSGSTGDYENMERLRRQVNADFVFTGQTSSLIGGSDAMLKKLDTNELPGRFYVFHKGDFIAINANFIRTNKDAQQFIVSKSASFFSQPIKILAPID